MFQQKKVIISCDTGPQTDLPQKLGAVFGDVFGLCAFKGHQVSNDADRMPTAQNLILKANARRTCTERFVFSYGTLHFSATTTVNPSVF